MGNAAVSTTAADAKARLRVSEIFLSLQGETTLSGWPTVFVRLTGCPLRCQYCDTPYAFHGGQWMDVGDIRTRVAGYGVRHVCVTGGEPLAQKPCLEMLRGLCDDGYTVSLETSGAMDVAGVDPRVVRILDIKTPGSGESGRNRLENLDVLSRHDEVKFVVCDRRDYEWARSLIRDRALHEGNVVLMSPSHDQLSARELADWMVEDRLPAKLQVQLHKYLWGNERGR